MATTPNATTPAHLSENPRALSRRWMGADEIAHLITLIAAAIILLIAVLLVYQLWVHSAESRAKFGWSFFVTKTWDPVSGDFGALPFIYGTLVTSAIGLLIAVPLGVGAAIFLAELAPPKLSSYLTLVSDLLAAVPSVIYGLLGVFLLVPLMRTVFQPALKKTLGFLPFFKGPSYGVGFLTAGIVLSIMIVPFVLSVSREVLLAVPQDQRQAALALGATKWESTWKVVVPAARTGIFGSVFLALARALGETMAVTMVIGNDPKIAASLFSPGYSIAAVLANEFSEATGNLYLSALIELGLVLFLLTFVLNGLARLLILLTTARGSGVLPT
jgi:phosphate transport system permease protein